MQDPDGEGQAPAGTRHEVKANLTAGFATTADATVYRVLARKYRPTGFEDLIGQEPMVRTLRNAFASGRIAQAYMLTGVRGVGKTTTARILARALNYEPTEPAADASAGPTLDMPAEGRHCRAILESRHVDVIEMDAASHTGIDDIREIIEAVRYRPAEARYKIYIIDEVHMLSKAAFNGLLKTLEEPPEHVKFVFATTEIRKVPITVLSRCQRFDLRRIDADLLVGHLEGIARKESVDVDEEALRMIARASEGSVRDSLSLLDQAIAHGGGRVVAEEVRAMLGIADRARVVDLFETVMSGDIAGAIAELDAQYAEGAAPEMVLADLAGFVHLVTRFRLVPEAADDASLAEAERARGAELAAKAAVPELTRAWQILLKGIAEVEGSPRPLAAAEMVLVRLAYAASLPSPGEVIRRLEEGAPLPHATPGGAGARAPAAGPVGTREPAGAAPAGVASSGAATAQRRETAPQSLPAATALPEPRDLRAVVALAEAKRDIKLQTALERYVRIVRFEPGRIELALAEGAPPDLVHDLSRRLAEWTGRRWVVAVSRADGAPTLREQASAARSALIDDMRRHPAVSAVLEAFPGAEIVDVRVEAPDAPAADGEAVDEETADAAPDEEDDGL